MSLCLLIMAAALVYLRIVAIGFVPSLIYNFGSAILRAKGKEKNADSIKNRAIVMGYYRSVFIIHSHILTVLYRTSF